MQLPLGIVSSSFAQAFSGSAADSFNNGKLNELFLSTMQLMLKYAVVPVLLLGVACLMLFPLFLGEEWSRAGEIAIWMIPAITLQMLSSATGSALYVTGNERLAFFIHLAGFLLRVFSTAISALYFPNYTIYIFAISGAFHYLLYLIAISIVCEATEKQCLQ